MKLSALFEYTFPTIRTRSVKSAPQGYDQTQWGDPDRPRPKLLKRGDTRHLGTGSFSSTYTNPKKSPEDVRKVSRPMEFHEVDGFYFLVRALEKHPDNGNPYFPRFRDITVYKDEKGQITYSAKMERLFHINDLTLSEKKALIARVFGETDSEEIAVYGVDWEDVTTSLVRGYNKYRDKIVDKDLIKATDFIREVKEKYKLSLDIHDDNLMVRKTPYGAQLVITDPLSFQ